MFRFVLFCFCFTFLFSNHPHAQLNSTYGTTQLNVRHSMKKDSAWLGKAALLALLATVATLVVVDDLADTHRLTVGGTTIAGGVRSGWSWWRGAVARWVSATGMLLPLPPSWDDDEEQEEDDGVLSQAYCYISDSTGRIHLHNLAAATNPTTATRPTSSACLNATGALPFRTHLAYSEAIALILPITSAGTSTTINAATAAYDSSFSPLMPACSRDPHPHARHHPHPTPSCCRTRCRRRCAR